MQYRPESKKLDKQGIYNVGTQTKRLYKLCGTHDDIYLEQVFHCPAWNPWYRYMKFCLTESRKPCVVRGVTEQVLEGQDMGMMIMRRDIWDYETSQLNL